MHVQGRPEAFTAYLEQYGNTICGRHPIGVLLNVCSSSSYSPALVTAVKSCQCKLLACCEGKLLVMSRLLLSAGVLQMLQHNQVGHVIRFQKYDQSAQCQSIRESSVSYAAAVMTIV